MWRRGADLDGYVANFVESEQIIQLKGFTSSFVQVCHHFPLTMNLFDVFLSTILKIVMHIP